MRKKGGKGSHGERGKEGEREREEEEKGEGKEKERRREGNGGREESTNDQPTNSGHLAMRLLPITEMLPKE